MPNSEVVKFHTVATYLHPMEAWIARNRLADEGIRAFVHGDNVATMYWLYAGAIHGVKVCVPEADAERAEKILADRNQVLGNVDQPEKGVPGDPQCCKCGSYNVHQSHYFKEAIYLCWLVLGTPLPIFRKQTHCFDCRHTDPPPMLIKARLPRQYSLASLFVVTLVVGCVLGTLRGLGFTDISTLGPTKAHQSSY